MNFLIDYDTLSVECKCDNADTLKKYITDNDLGLAVVIIGEPDDMLMEMSSKEVGILYHKLTDKPRKLENEEQAAEHTFALLQDTADDYPAFTLAVGKRLLKEAAKRSKDTTVTKGSAEAKPASKSGTEGSNPAKVKQGKRATDATVLTLGTEPKTNTLPRKIYDIVDDNMGEATLADIIDNRGDMTEEACRKQVTRCIRKGFIIKEDDL